MGIIINKIITIQMVQTVKDGGINNYYHTPKHYGIGMKVA